MRPRDARCLAPPSSLATILSTPPRNPPPARYISREREPAWHAACPPKCGVRGCIATITKELFHWTDTYVIDVYDSKDALGALMVVLAIDAEKCSRNN